MPEAVGVILIFGAILLALDDYRNKAIFPLIFAGLLFLGIGAAVAQEHHHPQQDQEIHEKFYSTWMMPDNRNVSCCHNEDCAPAESKYEDGQWLARKVGDTGNFTPIPPQKIERDRDTPDGRSHLCSRSAWPGMSIFCFIPGAGG
jgi:hypothetical protein